MPRQKLLLAALASAALITLVSLTASTPASAVSGLVLPTRGVGEPANDYPRGDACASGIAIDITFGSVCTAHCVTHEHCPEGWACKSFEQGNGERIGLCSPRRVRAQR